jgi:hypothetical protein
MSDNTAEISELRLQEIGNQLGTTILAPTTRIQVDDPSVPSPQSNADIQGTIDSQPSSKNPLLQYIVAGAIGLGAVGVPLTVLFGLGGTPTATKPTAPEVEDTTSSLADRELDNLKTQTALDIQAKGESQPVAQTPKPATTPTATTPAPTKTVAAAKPRPKPVVTAPAPKAITIAVQPPTVTATPATIARPVPIPVARPIPKPIPAPVIQQQLPIPIPVATQPTQPIQPTQSVAPELLPSLSFEQASALGMFGGDTDKPNESVPLTDDSDRSLLTLTLPVGANVPAQTVTPYTSLSSRTSATNNTETPLSVQLDQPIQLSQGFNLPVGTIVQFGATVADNGAVTATSKGVFIDGTEIKVPVGAFALTASNSTALVANQRSLREGELSGADTTAAMWGAAGSVGKALIDSGNTSVVNTSGLGTSVVQTNSGRVNIPGALLNGAFSPLAKAKESRANALAQELQRSSKLNEIPVRSPVRVFVAAAATVQVPVSSDVTTANAGMPAQGGILDGGNVERPPTMIPTKPLSAVDVQAPIAPLPTNNGAPTQPVVVPPLPTALNTEPVVVPSPVTATTQPTTAPTTQATQWINPQFPIAPTKPNNVSSNQPTIAPNPTVTQPTAVVTQPVTTQIQPIQSIQTPTVTTPQPLGTVPSPPAQPEGTATQPSVARQVSNGVVAQPIVTPTTIDPAITTQPTLFPQQPATTSEPTVVSPLVTTPQSIQPTTAPIQPAIAPSQPTKAITTTSPIAPTKPNNVVNIRPQSVAPIQATGNNTTPALVPIQSTSGIDSQSPLIMSPTQLIEMQNTQVPASATPQPTNVETQSGLVPIQFDNGGNIQPVTTPNPAVAPLF